MIATAVTCDASCPATAMVTVTMPSGGDLSFCAHHYLANAGALMAAGAEHDAHGAPDWLPPHAGVTPDVAPGRFTPEEASIARSGRCCWVTAYGFFGGDEHCLKPSQPGADFGYCPEHTAEVVS